MRWLLQSREAAPLIDAQIIQRLLADRQRLEDDLKRFLDPEVRRDTEKKLVGTLVAIERENCRLLGIRSFLSFAPDQIEEFYRNAVITYHEMRQYLRGWNTIGHHVCQAVWDGGAIRVFDPEVSGWVYRHLTEEFALQLPNPVQQRQQIPPKS